MASSQENGQCPSPAPAKLAGTRGAGASCSTPSDCEPTCCSCGAGARTWLAAVCSAGTCATDACAASSSDSFCRADASVSNGANGNSGSNSGGTSSPSGNTPGSGSTPPARDVCKALGSHTLAFRLLSSTGCKPGTYALGGFTEFAKVVVASGTELAVKVDDDVPFYGKFDEASCKGEVAFVYKHTQSLAYNLPFDFSTNAPANQKVVVFVDGFSCKGTYEVSML
jgi:hypothetical protein